MSEGAKKKEEKPRKFQAIRGTRDLLPPDTALWNRVEQTAHEVFATYGFGEIRPPIFEATDVFARSIGAETDIVGKEMYSFPAVRPQGRLEELVNSVERAWQGGEIDNTPENQQSLQAFKDLANQIVSAAGGATAMVNQEPQNQFRQIELNRLVEKMQRSFSLRPEATASVCRAYIEHNMQQLPQPVKLYYMGPMFRRERPQKGRYRQFYQIGAEILGGLEVPNVDAELIEMLMTFFAKIELQGAQLSINSIGCRDCRPEYVELLRAELNKVKDQLGVDSQRRIETNPLRVLDSKLEREQPIIEKLPHIANHLCEYCREHYAELKRQLDMRGVAYHENWRLVRGLDYYMRTTFEITAKGLGSQDAVCGGGRYDGLVELLGGPPTKGIGFAIGEDRLILSLQETKSESRVTLDQLPSVYIAWMGQNAYAAAIRAAKTLRNSGLRVELPPVEQKFGKALERASKLGSRFALILGDDEVASGHWTLKTLADGSQQKLTEPALLEYLRKL